MRGKYRLGLGILRLAGATTRPARPRAGIPSGLPPLAAESGETVNLAVLSEGAALYVDQVAGSRRCSPTTGSGSTSRSTRPPTARCCSAAWSRPRSSSGCVGRLPAYTHRTVTSLAELLGQLVTVRAPGYAVAADELEVGLTALAAPVRNAHGDVSPRSASPGRPSASATTAWSQPCPRRRGRCGGVAAAGLGFRAPSRCA